MSSPVIANWVLATISLTDVRDSVALGAEAAHEEDLEARGTEELRPAIDEHNDEFRAAAVRATPATDEAHSARPPIPSVLWLVYGAALTAGVYAVMRALAMAYKRCSLSTGAGIGLQREPTST